jgi:hypothetical protein
MRPKMSSATEHFVAKMLPLQKACGIRQDCLPHHAAEVPASGTILHPLTPVPAVYLALCSFLRKTGVMEA